MRKLRLIHALTVAAALTATAGISAQPRRATPAKPAARDWTQVVSATPEGGIRMGNPNARVKLVEYASLTCPHCAAFSKSAKAPLSAEVRTGKLSFEFRNYFLNSIDVTATLLARCASPSRFFPFVERLYATQPQWIGRITGMSQAHKDALQKLPDDQQIVRVAEIGGLTGLAAGAGLTPVRARACLTDRAGLERLVQVRKAADAAGINHTPSFLINGVPVEGHDWAELLPAIRKAGG